MSYLVRAARPADVEQFYELALLTGGGFTNLPPDRESLAKKLERSERSYAGEHDDPGNDLFFLALEDAETGQIRGTAQVFAAIGKKWPFYSYRINALTQRSEELDRTFNAGTLTLTTDYQGASEVGGLFLHPDARSGGIGLLLARSRYLFIAMHRERFADRVVAELRGVIDENGDSPFWDGLAGKFFGMGFKEADEFNATHGNQFIADLMPTYPVYLALLPEEAIAVMGHPHSSGRAAMRMLEKEGFEHKGYVDIFDGGPTMEAEIDDLRGVRDSRVAKVISTDADGDDDALIATGQLADFRCCIGIVEPHEGGIAIDAGAAQILKAGTGDEVRYAAR